jgi:hypothetical protein
MCLAGDGGGNGRRKKRLGVDADVAGDGAMPSGSGLAAQGLPAAEVLAGVAAALLRGVPAGDGLLLLLPTPPPAVARSPAPTASSCPAAADTEMVVVPPPPTTPASPSACTFLA